jgi:hypothetical protein
LIAEVKRVPVLKSPQIAVRPFTARLLCAIFLFSFAGFSASPADTTLDDAVLQLAARIAAIPNIRGPFHLQFFQDAAFQSQTGKDWQDIFRKDLLSHRISLTDDPSANPLRVGVAENPTQLVLSASVHVADKDEVRFLAIPRNSFRVANLPVAPVRVERQLIYQSPDRILDASSLWNGAEGGLAVLVSHNSELSVLRIDSTGQTTQTVSLSGAGISPTRDLRGELSVRATEMTVVLPSAACDFNWSTTTSTTVEAKCHPAKTIGRLPTVLTPSCDTAGWKLLADGPDWSTPDALQVVPAGTLRQGSAALISEFPGPILGINGEQNPAGALVVTKNLRTGNYEVYKITLACGN